MRALLRRNLLPLAFLLVGLCYVATASGCSILEQIFLREAKPGQIGPLISSVSPTPGAVGNVMSLPQGWTEDTQRRWWFTSQGSEIVPYAYFLYLEQADTQTLFRSNDNIAYYGYLPQTPMPGWNPDGLPVGFAKTTDPQSGVDWMGFTCAACHTAQIAVGDTLVRVEGGPTIADYRSFQDDLNTALSATARDDAKFDRFARAVLDGGYSDAAAATLRDDLREVIANLDRRNQQNESTIRDGYARIDALGQIFNSVTAYDLGIDANARPPDAPVSYPFLWGTAQTDYVQWNGSVANKGAGPVGRNVGEMLGVFGHVDIDPRRGLRGYHSSLDEDGIAILEVWLEDLWSPQWPQDILPAIDSTKAERGSWVFRTTCGGCHYTIDRTDEDRRYPAIMAPPDVVGTDPKVLDNFRGWLADTAVATGVLEGHPSSIVTGAPFARRGSGLDVLANAIAGVLLEHKVSSVRTIVEDYVQHLPEGAEDTYAYKARPLTGIWATAPYLHNGSVPTLYDLLRPEAQRPATFGVGNRTYDHVKVGYVTTPGPGGYMYNTSLPGNRNTGHLYGTTLSEAHRNDLLEYLKTL